MCCLGRLGGGDSRKIITTSCRLEQMVLTLVCACLSLVATGLLAPTKAAQYRHRAACATRMPKHEASSQELRLRKLDKFSVLVLNADYQPLSFMPLSVWSWQDAIKAVWQGRVDVVDTYELSVRSARTSIDLPSVVVLKQYESKKSRTPQFSKRLLLLRDEFRCQYCSTTSKALTCDHVQPRSKGGRSTWTNTVAACKECNAKKRNLSKDQLKSVGLVLATEPFVPTPYQLETIARRRCLATWRSSGQIHASWQSYLVG